MNNNNWSVFSILIRLIFLVGSLMFSFLFGLLLCEFVNPEIGDVVFSIGVIAGFMIPSIVYLITFINEVENKLCKRKNADARPFATIILVILISVMLALLIGWRLSIILDGYFNDNGIELYSIKGGVVGFLSPIIIYISIKISNISRHIEEDEAEEKSEELKETDI